MTSSPRHSGEGGGPADYELELQQDASSRHLGPMAQDFYAAFGVGLDDKHIATVMQMAWHWPRFKG